MEGLTVLDFNKLIMPVKRKSVFKMDGWHVWCGSMVQGEDGLYYLFFSRWPESLGHKAWVTHSEVAYAVSQDPLGPYTYKGIALQGSGGDNWDADVIHNPTVIKINGKYYMYYTGNKGNGEYWVHRNNQRIGVAVADVPSGPWKRFDRPVIDISPGSWDHLMTSNPTVTQMYDGKVLMVYKGVGNGELPKGGAVVCGVAIADNPEGPFKKAAGPIMVNPENDWSVEDPFIWRGDDRYYALVKDFQGYFTGGEKGSVALFESIDGIDWQVSEHAFAFKREIRWEDGEIQKMTALERPQLWLNNGKPAVLFCAAAADELREIVFNVHIPLRQDF